MLNNTYIQKIITTIVIIIIVDSIITIKKLIKIYIFHACQ